MPMIANPVKRPLKASTIPPHPVKRIITPKRQVQKRTQISVLINSLRPTTPPTKRPPILTSSDHRRILRLARVSPRVYDQKMLVRLERKNHDHLLRGVLALLDYAIPTPGMLAFGNGAF